MSIRKDQKPLLVGVPPALHKRIRHFAIDAEKTQTAIICDAISHYLDEKENEAAKQIRHTFTS